MPGLFPAGPRLKPGADKAGKVMNKKSHRTPAGREKRASGFTLIEITLALLVVSTGILAIMAIFVSGMDQGRRSTVEDRMASFGEVVLAGIRHNADRNWTNFASADIPPAIGDDLWSAGFRVKTPNGTSGGTEIFAPGDYGGPGTNFLASAVFTKKAVPGMADHAFRYTIIATNVVITNVDSGTLKFAVTNKGVILYMFQGEFGGAENPDMWSYTELFNFEAP